MAGMSKFFANGGKTLRLDTILQIRNKTRYLEVINKSVIYKFPKDFINIRKKTYTTIVFSRRSFINIFKRFNNEVNKVPPDTVEKIQMVAFLIDKVLFIRYSAVSRVTLD